MRPFSLAKTSDMEYYITPTKRDFDPGIYILHVGTNDLTLNDTPEEITEHIVNIATSLKTENNTVVISNIDHIEIACDLRTKRNISDRSWQY